MNDTTKELRKTTDKLRETTIWLETGNEATEIQVRQLRRISGKLDRYANDIQEELKN